ncbi:MAG: YfcC family protein, partial [Deltaproteobacteria bacterium]
ADPKASLVADVPKPPDLRPPDPVEPKGRHALVSVFLAAAFGLVVWGIKTRGWYLEEMTATFLGLGILVVLVGRLGADEGARTFIGGAAELTLTALLIGFARGIKIVLEDGKIIDTVIDAVATPLASAGPEASALGMFVFQSILNFFIPSGSGQAYVTMPIMAPLADLTGVSRQIAVLAYQFGDGLTNMIVPTNAVLVGILGMAGIPFERWLRFMMPAMVRLWLICIAALLVALWIGYD